jgi:hypothetical protein
VDGLEAPTPKAPAPRPGRPPGARSALTCSTASLRNTRSGVGDTWANEAEAHRRDSLPAFTSAWPDGACDRKRQARSLFQGRDRAAEGSGRGLRPAACRTTPLHEKARRDVMAGLEGGRLTGRSGAHGSGLWLKGTSPSWLRWCSPYRPNAGWRVEVLTTNSRCPFMISAAAGLTPVATVRNACESDHEEHSPMLESRHSLPWCGRRKRCRS